MPFQRDRKVDTRGSMSVTLPTCLLLAMVLAPVVEGACTVVVNGPNDPGMKGDPGHQAGGAV